VVLEKRDLTLAGFFTEREWLAANKGDALVVPYRGLDTSKASILLVHGLGPVLLMRDLAERLHDKDRQVLFAFYDNMGTPPQESGYQLAKDLLRICQCHYREAMRLDVVGHSLGGIVARCVLNYLHEPEWLGESKTDNWRLDERPMTNRFRTIDAPFSGFGNRMPLSPSSARRTIAFLGGILDIFGLDGVMELYADSEMFQKLFSVELEGVGFQNHAAFRPGRKDFVLSFAELTPEQARSMVLAIVEELEPESARLRNLLRAIREDSRYSALRDGVRLAREAGDISLNRAPTSVLTRRLAAIYFEAMPTFESRHISMVRDKTDTDFDVVDHLVRELCK